ncbi:MAG: hypothetical protein ACSHX4_12675 [Opitutaceae bacterium]
MFADHLEITTIRHLLDFGMMVLLWLVQLVIYPSFLHVQKSSLVQWHKTYTSRVLFVIVPMMVGQMGLVIHATLMQMNLRNIFALMLIAFCWLLSFAVSVPLHRTIEQGEGDDTILHRLVRTNWPRTILWTLAFVVGLLA